MQYFAPVVLTGRRQPVSRHVFFEDFPRDFPEEAVFILAQYST